MICLGEGVNMQFLFLYGHASRWGTRRSSEVHLLRGRRRSHRFLSIVQLRADYDKLDAQTCLNQEVLEICDASSRSIAGS